MAVDAELISSEGFNLNLKNYLRDFFTYQFKEKNADFKQKGNKTECNTFKALSPGKAIITATSSNGIKANCIVSVIQDSHAKRKKKKEFSSDTVKKPSSISFKTKHITMAAGNNRKIAMNVLPKDADKRIDYFSSNESVAKVVSGKILAIKQGSCEITATTKNGLNDKCIINVIGEEIHPSALAVDFQDIEVHVGEEFRLTAFVEPITSTSLEIVWNTSDESIIDVSERSTIGMFVDKILNKNIVDSKFNYDSERLRFALEQSVGISWSKGEIVDLSKGQIDKNKANKRVECVTVDGKRITKNPFQEIYKCCLEDSTHLGQSFLLTYFLIFHFHLGSVLERYDNVPLKKEELSTLNDHFRKTAVKLESKTRRRNPRSWDMLSEEEKCFFGKMALEKFEIFHIENRNEKAKREYDGIAEPDEIKRIYDNILLQNKKVVFVDNNFVVVDKLPLQPSFVEKNILYDIYKKYVNSEGLDEKQFGNNLSKLTRMGILLSKKQGERLYYALSNVFLGEILGNNEDLRIRFAEMVTFFSQILPLGEIGNYISNRITNKNVQYMKFKHRYLTRALNDYNIIDLLSAIAQKKWIEIEYRNASVVDLKYQKFVCLPLEIRESVIDGRQYLLYYHPNFRSVSAARVEFIDSIKLGEIKEEPFIQEDLERAEELIAYTWGTSFGDFKNGNVKKRPQINRVRAIIKCAENEFYIKNRVQRECRNCISIKSITDVKNGHCFELLVELVNFKEFMQWLRSLTCRVVSIEVNGTEYFRFYDDIIRTARLYHITELNRLCDDEKIAYEKETLIEFKNEFEEFNSLHDMLFNEMFSEPFYRVGCVLFDLFKQDNVDKEDIIKTYDKLWRYTVAPDRKEQLKFVLNPFVVSVKRKKGGTIWSEHEDVQIPALSFKSNCEIGSMWDLIPLTKVEIQWIQNILCHPLAKCFLTPNEIKKIKFNLPKMNLFDVNKVVLHDQFLDMGSFYARIDFGDTVRTILQAIREKRAINMQYKDQYGVCAQLLCYPSHIEYSKRDNKIRIIGVREDVVRTYNIERIQNVSISDDYFDYNAVTEMINAYDANECNIKVFFKEIKNVPDRILTEFSCYRKTCSKFRNNEYEYQMTLYYKKEEAKEILVRLLSYGPYITLGEDHDAEGHNGAVKTEYLDRIERQLELIKSREIVRETIEKRHSELQR